MFKEEVLERFLRYAKVDTMSDDKLAQSIHPSTPGQWDLLKMLRDELIEMGLKDATLDDKGYLLAHLEATDPTKDCIAFSSHVDTASDVMGNGVKPRVVRNYDGKDITLNSSYSILAKDNPDLASYIGTDLVVTDGNTLLGGDDKAGVAEIMTAVHYLACNPQIKRGEVEVLFSPDEETGFGMDFFNPEKLHAKALYTVDGGTRYEVEAECFNAASVEIKFTGVSYHLGAARGRMVNAVTMLSYFVNALPQAESPEATDERYGYYCAHEISGSACETTLTVLLRDFDLDNLNYRIEVLKNLAKTTELLYKGGKVEVSARYSYYNMINAALSKPKALNAVYEAGKVLGQDLVTRVIRGGTDGARIAQSGIPCPNLYTGVYNMHSRFEWCAVEAMNDSVKLIVETVRQWAL